MPSWETVSAGNTQPTFCIDNNILWVFKCVQPMRFYSVGHLYLQFLYFLAILLKFVSAKLLISSFL